MFAAADVISAASLAAVSTPLPVSSAPACVCYLIEPIPLLLSASICLPSPRSLPLPVRLLAPFRLVLPVLFPALVSVLAMLPIARMAVHPPIVPVTVAPL